MRLRSRILLIIAVSFSLLAALVAAVNSSLVVSRFRQLETIEVAEQLNRLRAILKTEADSLGNRISDWSSWDDLWGYLAGTNPNFLAQQMTPSSLTGNAVQLMVFLDAQGRVIHREVQPGDGGAARSAALARLIQDTPALRPTSDTRDTVIAGLLALDEGLVLYAARPVLHSDGSGPVSGTLVWVRDFNEEQRADLASRLHSQVSLWRKTTAPAEVAVTSRHIVNAGTVAGATLLSDALGQESILAQVALPRRTWAAGMSTLWWQAGTTLLALLATGMGALWIIDRLITRRVLLLAKQTASGDQGTQRIHIEGHDELTELARQIDGLRSRLQQMHREALTTADAKATFLATMSHEIRTPLNGVIGMIGLLARTSLNAEQREYADIIRASADGLLLLLNDILDFSKIEAGRLELEKVPFRLASVLGDAAAVLATRIHDKNVSLVLAFDPALPERVVGDPGRLRQVVTNLVSNAAKFTEQGCITVRANAVRDGGSLKLTVAIEDTGIGMDAATCGKLFQAFAQAEAATSRKYGGTGLGLAICRRLVELMGGTIGVSSVPGRGSNFTFSLVLASDGEDQPLPSPLTPGQTVLIACGRPTLRTWLIQVVEHWGGVALPVGDAQTLTRVMNGEAPGLALVDGTLPGQDDHPPAHTLMERWPGVPLVVMTLPQDGQAPPGTVSISHPVRIERLCRAINDARTGNVSLPPVNTAPERLRFSGRVLVVDDHPINRRLANVLLTNLGLEVLEAVDGQQALDVMAHEPLALVLMDCQMPVLDGLESSRRWRASESPNSHLPIIALTANVFSDDRQRCQAAGMDGFLGKPLREEELIQILRTHLPQVLVTRDAQALANEPVDSAAATPAPAHTVFDPRTRALLEGMPGTVAGTSLFQELTSRFRAEFSERFDQLVAQVIGEETRGAAQMAHALKGSSLTLGMNALGSVLSQVEQHARSNDLAGAVQLLGIIEEEWRRVTDDLDAPARSSA